MTSDQKTKQTIYNTTRNICKEVGRQLNVEYESDALDLISELVYKKLLMYGTKLDYYQKHAKRSTVNTDDVKLLTIGNSSLKETVENLIEKLEPPNKPAGETSGTTKRKRKAT